jgi:hypothetical protein
MKQFEKELKQRMVLKDIVLVLKIHLMMNNLLRAISQLDNDAVNKEINDCFAWIEGNLDAAPETF